MRLSSSSSMTSPFLSTRSNLYSAGSGGKNVSAPATDALENPDLTHRQKSAVMAGGQQQQHMVCCLFCVSVRIVPASAQPLPSAVSFRRFRRSKSAGEKFGWGWLREKAASMSRRWWLPQSFNVNAVAVAAVAVAIAGRWL
mmetsp:Transcript_31969/g.95746  ORF Transcript_31969/g.95746 Transcript_31969/m.95746 type:complete len:141 (+) Transcript_31969:1613-2035(+)